MDSNELGLQTNPSGCQQSQRNVGIPEAGMCFPDTFQEPGEGSPRLVAWHAKGQRGEVAQLIPWLATEHGNCKNNLLIAAGS